jgi:hypothetical protein
MPHQPAKATNTDIFQHALYHHVAHWAAYVGMMVAEITITAILSTASAPITGLKFKGAVWAIAATTVGAGYFILGMNTYGAVLCDALPESYLVRTQTFRHRITILVGGLAALVAGAVNGIMLYYASQSN